MHFTDIQAAIKRSGSSQAAISRKTGVSQTVVYQVIRGIAKSRKVANEISRVTGHSVSQLFPGLYSYAGRGARRAA